MAFDPKEKAAQLRLQQARVKPAPRLPKSGQESARFPGQGNSNQQWPASSNPRTNQQRLGLVKSLATGQRDRSKSLVAQGLGKAGAEGGRLLGGTIGSAIPVVGNVAGAAIGKRVGRVAGENWKITLGVLAAWAIFTILPFIMLVGTVLLVLTTLLSNTKAVAAGGTAGAAGVGLGIVIDYFSK